MICAPLATEIPPAPILYGAGMLAGLCLFFRMLQPPALFTLAICWALIQFQIRLDDRLHESLTNQAVTLSGVVASIASTAPGPTQFRFKPDPAFRSAGFPSVLLLSWYPDRPAEPGRVPTPHRVLPGEHWRLEIKAKPPWGSVNFQGADKERWLFAQGIGGLGTVRAGRLLEPASGVRFVVDRIRTRVLNAIAAAIPDRRQQSVIQALATADRSGLVPADRMLLTSTGTAHLLAISGLHVGLAAAGGMWLCRILILLLPVSRLAGATLMLTVTGGILSALGYSALAGFGIPTQRSVLMLLTVSVAVLMSRSIHPVRAWTIGLAAVVLINPFAVLGAGLWFSFLAVAALILVLGPRMGALRWWKTVLLAQAAVILMLLPVSATWFGAFSPAGFAANLLAIPWVSFLIVPPVLTGVAVLPFFTPAANALWSLAGLSVSYLFQVLKLISDVQGQMLFLPQASVFQAALALAGVILCLLPRGLSARWIGLFLLVPLFLPPGPRTREGAVSLEVLDAGQGTAVLLSSGEHSLLYDSGPGDGKERSMVGSAITPALSKIGPRAPDHVVISHADLDHAGGLGLLRQRYPLAEYRANLGVPDEEFEACTAPVRLQWQGISIRTLHPSRWLPYLGNDSSCVLSVTSGAGNILLSGDISETIERRLLREGIQRHRLLLVPHHGSKTSSSREFIEKLQPEAAIATASLGNRFGFPIAEIRERYEAAGTEFWSTGDCGALRVILDTDGSLQATSARRERKRVWRWPPAENCP